MKKAPKVSRFKFPVHKEHKSGLKVPSKDLKCLRHMVSMVVNSSYNGLMEATSQGGLRGPKPPMSRSGGFWPPGCLAGGTRLVMTDFLTHRVMARSISDRLERLINSSEYFFVSGGTLTELVMVWNEATVRPCHGGLVKKVFVLHSFWEAVLGQLMETIGIIYDIP